MRASLMRGWRHHEQLRFLVVGAWNTAFGYGVFLTLYLLLQDAMHYLAIAVLAYRLK